MYVRYRKERDIYLSEKYTKNSEQTKKKSDKRLDNLVPFKKGESGNALGRPKGSKNKSTILREMLALKGVEQSDPDMFYMSQYIDIITRKDQDDEMKSKALEKLFDRVYGKPKSTVEHGRTPADLEAAGNIVTQLILGKEIKTDDFIDAEEAEVVNDLS